MAERKEFHAFVCSCRAGDNFRGDFIRDTRDIDFRYMDRAWQRSEAAEEAGKLYAEFQRFKKAGGVVKVPEPRKAELHDGPGQIAQSVNALKKAANHGGRIVVGWVIREWWDDERGVTRQTWQSECPDCGIIRTNGANKGDFAIHRLSCAASGHLVALGDWLPPDAFRYYLYSICGICGLTEKEARDKAEVRFDEELDRHLTEEAIRRGLDLPECIRQTMADALRADVAGDAP